MKNRPSFPRLIFLFLSLGFLPSFSYSSDYFVLERSMSGSKLKLNVQVQLVNGQLPDVATLANISNQLVRPNGTKRAFVFFYLPGMKVGSGAFATAHHLPKMKVIFQTFMLSDYPEYAHLSQ